MNIEKGASQALDRILRTGIWERLSSVPEPEQFAKAEKPLPKVKVAHIPEGIGWPLPIPKVQPVGTLPVGTAGVMPPPIRFASIPQVEGAEKVDPFPKPPAEAKSDGDESPISWLTKTAGDIARTVRAIYEPPEMPETLPWWQKAGVYAVSQALKGTEIAKQVYKGTPISPFYWKTPEEKAETETHEIFEKWTRAVKGQRPDLAETLGIDDPAEYADKMMADYRKRPPGEIAMRAYEPEKATGVPLPETPSASSFARRQGETAAERFIGEWVSGFMIGGFPFGARVAPVVGQAAIAAAKRAAPLVKEIATSEVGAVGKGVPKGRPKIPKIIPKEVTPITPEVTKLPEGWTERIGKTKVDETGEPIEASLDYKSKVITFRDKESMGNQLIRNHEIAHVMEFNLTGDANEALVKEYSNVAKSEGIITSEHIRMDLHREMLIVNLGETLTNPGKVNPKIVEVFRKFFPEIKVVIPRAKVTLEVAGVKPPVEPPKPPAAVGAVAPEDAIKNFWKAASTPEAAGHWETTRGLRMAERAKRTAIFNDELTKFLEKGMEPEEALNQVRKMALSGKLPSTSTTLGDLITPEIRSAMFAKIEAELTGNAYEITATSKALGNALAGKPIPRAPGVKGGSAYSRLEKVFGDNPEFMKAIEKPSEFLDKMKEPQPPTGGKWGLPVKPYGQPEMEFGGTPRVGALQRKMAAQEAQEELELRLELAEEPSVDYLSKLPKETVIKQMAMLPKSMRGQVSEKLRQAGISLLDSVNLLRTLQTAYDASVMFRQLLVAGAYYPAGWFRQWKPLFQSFKSPELAKAWEQEWLKNPDVLLAIKGMGGQKLEWSEWGIKAARALKEEPYVSAFASRIPGIRASERAFTIPANGMRASIIVKQFPIMRELGLPEEAFGEMIKLTNLLTGRATLGEKLRNYAPLLNAVLYSPRLIKARIELPTTLAAQSPYVRKQSWLAMTRFLSFGATVLGIYKSLGGEIEFDPRSSDVGKLIIGNTRLDVWGGYIQYARFAAQVVVGERKAVTTGKVYPIDRWETLLRFFQSKFSPGIGLLADVMASETYAGEELKADIETLREQAISRLAPLYAQDIYDAVRLNEGIAGTLASTAGGLGVGVISYKPKPIIGGEPVNDESESKLNVELKRLDIGQIGWVENKVKGIELTPEIKDDYQASLGKASRQAILKLIGTSGYARASDNRKKELLRDAMSDVNAELVDKLLTTTLKGSAGIEYELAQYRIYMRSLGDVEPGVKKQAGIAFREANPLIDAALFLREEVSTVRTEEAARLVTRLAKILKIDLDTINAMRPNR